MSKKEKILFTVDGFEVYDDRVYRVFNKQNLDAPSGLIKEKTSKIPSEGIGDTFSFKFIGEIWDTGFHDKSPCYRQQEAADIKDMVATRRKNILKPYQDVKGDTTAFELSNPEFLDKPHFEVFDNQTYATSDPVQRMALYAALLGKKVAPRSEEKNPVYRLCSYLIDDATRVSKQKNEDGVNLTKAVRQFEKMYESDPESLKTILTWLSLGSFSEGTDIDTISTMFRERVQDDPAKIRQFLKAYDEIKGQEEGHLKYFLHQKLVDQKGRNRNITVGANGRFFYAGIELGPEPKSAAENLARNPDLQAYREEILSDGKIVATPE